MGIVKNRAIFHGEQFHGGLKLKKNFPLFFVFFMRHWTSNLSAFKKKLIVKSLEKVYK